VCPDDQRHALGAILAGGRGTRLGASKPVAELCGRPLIDYPLAAFAAAGIDAVVVAKRDSALPKLAVPVWREPDEPAHPLHGIVTALERTDGRPLVVCGCDMPFVSAPLLRSLAESEQRLVVPHAADRLHPLLARYDPTLLESLRSALASQRPLQDVIAELDPVLIGEPELRAFGDPDRLLFNVNTPGDLARAGALLEGR
jgi:molybdopterin-guanine dinucleotide biosynthesis protein A